MQKKAFISLIFALIASTIYGSVAAHADPSSEACKAYADLLCTPNAFPDLSGTYAGGFATQDINNDGIPELCVFEGESANSLKTVYTFYDGTVQEISSMSKYGSYYGLPTYNLFIEVWSRWDRGEYNDIYLFDGRTLKKIMARQYNRKEELVAYYDHRGGTQTEITETMFNAVYEGLTAGKEPLELFTNIQQNTRDNRIIVLGSGGTTSSPGRAGSGAEYDLSNFGYRTVRISGPGTLVFQSSPNGAFMNDYQFNNGDAIYVNLSWNQNGYALAYKDGVYGYVDAGFIDWNNSGPSSDGRYELSNYAQRIVNTSGRGMLVFQSAPNGSFMYDYQFGDGNSIYVNLYWRQDGYAIACQNGVYGYVDASYINWNSSVTTDTGSDGRYDLSNYAYRTVSTRGRGSLVFQSSPNGSFMYDYDYSEGSEIYVNLNWRQEGYAIAYRNGTYGYVDASYISW